MNLALLGQQARQSFKIISRTTGASRQAAVQAMADQLEKDQAEVVSANQQDVQAARQAELALALIDRLMLNVSRLADLVNDLRLLADLPDPVGQEFDQRSLPNGLRIARRRVPLGVLGVIYEARPNVTIDVAALAVKTGNAVILRGGKETLHTNRALLSVIHRALRQSGLPETCVQFIDDTDRSLVGEMLHMNDYIDVIIPRGGAGLHEFCRRNATIPVITGGIGICHLFVDSSANLEAALPVIYNAKTQRPSVCNSLDTLLVHQEVASSFLPQVAEYLAPAGVSFRLDPSAAPYIDHPQALPAGEDDFDTEWLSLVLGIKVVANLEAAIAHIQAHSTGHSDGILTDDEENARRFLDEIDSAAVYVNASTRFTDGAQLGLGAEVAVSTQRLHARGPMGLPELTTYKWIIQGNYTTRP